MHEVGSFNWYINLDEHFFTYLTKSIMHADYDNIRKLRKIFPHICEAHKEPSWDKAPEIEYPITINITYLFPEEKDITGSTSNGTFSGYLHRSGHFVTNLSHAIAYADKHNKRLISFQFPQMVAAYYMPSWDMCPSGFDWNSYNAPYNTFEKTPSS